MFRYDPDLLVRFPTVRAGVVRARGLDNRSPRSELARAFRAEQQVVRERLGETPLAELPSIASWRRVFSAFGVSPTKYRNAAEALLRRLTKRGDLPEINPLVDLGNLASIRHALPLIVVDLERVAGTLTVREATGEEVFADLGGTEGAHPQPGEVIFVDDAGEAVARRWCWRQSANSAAGVETTEALLVVEAHHDGAEDDVAAAVATIVDLLRDHFDGAEVDSHVV